MKFHKIGRYNVKSELGRGGMSTVYHAHDPRFRRDVAIKVLPREFLHDPTFRARFEREAQTIATLEHSAIVPVYDFGEDDGQLYLVMRLLSGGSLSTRLEKGGLLLNEIVHIINRVAIALDEAHNHGIIHRDLKPDNILFDHHHDPFITDFGIAKLSQDSSSLTATQAVMGTPAYMSPEQVGGEELDMRSDIYALGVIVFQMLTGQLPYNASSPVGLLMKHLTEPVPDILEIKPDLPSGCATVISQAMAKEREKRYAKATLLATDLTRSINTPLASQAQPIRPATPKKEQIYSRPTENIIPTPKVTLTSPQKTTPISIKYGEKQVCPSCGVSLPDDLLPNQQFGCTQCGTALILTGTEQDGTIACPVCFTPNPADTTHCVYCKTQLQRSPVGQKKPTKTKHLSQKEPEQAIPVEEKLPSLLDQLTNPKKQASAIDQLARMDEDVLKPLVDMMLHHDDPCARYGSVKALSQICKGTQIKAPIKRGLTKILIKALSDSDPEVRYWAAEALGKFSGQLAELAIKPLATLLKDLDEKVRQQAQSSLQQIGGEQVREILARPLVICLKIGKLRQRKVKVTLDKPIHLGRTEPDVFSPEIDLTQDNSMGKGISRRHARISAQAGTVVIEDLGSSNGTFIDGKRLSPHSPQVLHHNDQFYLGGLFIEVEIW